MSILRFLGNGSCFNTEFGNTSAYCYVLVTSTGQEIRYTQTTKIIPNVKKKLILFDCGETVFDRILKLNLLQQIDMVDIYITHLHSDHAGSLPSLIFYLFMVKNIKPRIISSVSTLTDYLRLCNVPDHIYERSIDVSAIGVHQQHGYAKEAYGYIVNIYSNINIYYSGDSASISPKILDYFNGKSDFFVSRISEFYQDVTKYENDSHMNIHKFANIIKPEKRSKITCMHFDDKETLDIAKSYGFNVATVEEL